MKKKIWISLTTAAVLLVGGLIAAKARESSKPGDAPSSPFRLGQAQVEPLEVSVREVGVVDPLRKVDVKSAISGRVVSMAIREGAVVRTGTVLAEVEPDVTQAQSLADVYSDVSLAEVRLRDADKEWSAQKALLDAGLVGTEQFRAVQTRREVASEDLRAAKARHRIVQEHGIPIGADGSARIARVTSPMNGVVITRGVELGETVTSGVSSYSEGTVLFTVADLDSLIVRVDLNEVDIAKVATGQRVRVTLDAWPQKVFDGQVRFVAPAAKLVDRIKVFEVEVALDALDPAFRTGMSANVEILGERREKALSIPLESLHRRGGETVAYRLKKGIAADALAKAKEGLGGREKYTWLADHWKDYFEVVPVKAGLANLERVEILTGLAAGDEISLEDPSRRKIEKDDENN